MSETSSHVSMFRIAHDFNIVSGMQREWLFRFHFTSTLSIKNNRVERKLISLLTLIN